MIFGDTFLGWDTIISPLGTIWTPVFRGWSHYVDVQREGRMSSAGVTVGRRPLEQGLPVDFISLRSDYDTTDRTRDSDILTEVAAEGGTPDRGGGGCA